MEGGIVRIVVPDGKRFLNAYSSGDPTALKELIADEPWFEEKWNTPMELINLVFRQGIEHKFIYDYDTIKYLFSFYGFQTEEKKFNQSSIPQFVMDSPERKALSLYVEATKISDS